jgi:hypothetical protein
VKVAILKYGSHLHFLKSSVRRRKRSPHMHARSPRRAGRGGAKGAWHLREWSATRSPFAVLVFGLQVLEF